MSKQIVLKLITIFFLLFHKRRLSYQNNFSHAYDNMNLKDVRMIHLSRLILNEMSLKLMNRQVSVVRKALEKAIKIHFCFDENINKYE